MKLNTLKLNPKNPRVIKDDKFKQLVKSIQEFPEMMAKRPMVCVTDPVDGKLFPLGGNMRLKALQHLKFADVPDEWVSLADDWTEEKRAEFTIKDNVGYGDWNWGELSEDWDIDLLSDWGLDVPISDKVDNISDGETIEVEKSVQLEPPMEYILILAEPNSVEWEELKEMLKLKMVKRGGYKDGSPFNAIGLERVIKWDDFKNRLNVSSSTK